MHLKACTKCCLHMRHGMLWMVYHCLQLHAGLTNYSCKLLSMLLQLGYIVTRLPCLCPNDGRTVTEEHWPKCPYYWPKAVGRQQAEVPILLAEGDGPTASRSANRVWPKAQNTGQPRPSTAQSACGRLLAERGGFGCSSPIRSIACYS